MVAALHQHAGAAERERLLDLLEDHRLRQQVALAPVAGAAVEGAEVAVGDADVRVVDVAVDDERDRGPGSVRRPRSSFATRPTATRSRDSSSASASASVMRSPSSAFSRIARRSGSQSRSPSDRRSGGDEPQLGHLVELADLVRELEERVEAGALARAEAVAQLLEVAREEAGRVAVALRPPRTRAARVGARGAHRRDERVLELEQLRDAPARAPPRPRTPSAGRCARARAGRDRGAASDPRTPTSARRRRSAASPRRPRRAARGSASGSSTFVSTTEVADSGVTATVRIALERQLRDELDRVDGALATRRRAGAAGAASRRCRAYSIDEIGAVSSSPATSRRLSSVGTPDDLLVLGVDAEEDRRHVRVRDAPEPDHPALPLRHGTSPPPSPGCRRSASGASGTSVGPAHATAQLVVERVALHRDAAGGADDADELLELLLGARPSSRRRGRSPRARACPGRRSRRSAGRPARPASSARSSRP